MIKKSYFTGETSEVKGPSNDLVPKESATEMGAMGFSANEMTSEYDATDPDIYKTEKYDSGEKIMPDELMKILVSLGDSLDQSGEEKLASFSDFLIEKFAQVEEINYTVLFNQLMIKVNNADLVNTNEIIKKLGNIYSRTIVLEFMKSKDLNKSKESAYTKVLHRAEQYLGET